MKEGRICIFRKRVLTFKMYTLRLLLLLFPGASNAQINKNCNDESISGLHFCSSEDYYKGVGDTSPLLVGGKITIFDIPEFRPDDKTITIFMKLSAFWNDTRIKTESSDPDL